MKTKFVIFYVQNQKPDKTCPEGWVEATSILEALKSWHINLKGIFFKNSVYQAEKAI